MLIGIPLQTAEGETRVALTPETAKKLKAHGHVLRVQAGAGWRASIPDPAYASVGCEMTDAAGALGADLVLTVRPPVQQDLALMKPDAVLVGMLDPHDKDSLSAWRRLA
ncbi:NAD(P) transhydrogenase subunit alpha (plasmid) [Ralstonia syzygii]